MVASPLWYYLLLFGTSLPNFQWLKVILLLPRALDSGISSWSGQLRGVSCTGFIPPLLCLPHLNILAL